MSHPVATDCLDGTPKEHLFSSGYGQVNRDREVTIGDSNTDGTAVLRNANADFTQYQTISSDELSIDALTNEIGVEIESISTNMDYPIGKARLGLAFLRSKVSQAS